MVKGDLVQLEYLDDPGSFKPFQGVLVRQDLFNWYVVLLEDLDLFQDLGDGMEVGYFKKGDQVYVPKKNVQDSRSVKSMPC